MKMSDKHLEAAIPLFVTDTGTQSSRLEQEVVALFDEFRNPLLRYLVSLGLPVQDGEEIIQETFLALFQHLRAGKDRRNLRGWLFRVAHNQGLRRRSLIHYRRLERRPHRSADTHHRQSGFRRGF